MIVHESSYKRWLQKQGVGSKDRVADSAASYISYLRSVSSLLGEAISPEILSDEGDVERILRRIRGMRADNTVRNYGSAMRQYVAMVEAGAHP
ncbi:hypothetical protein [Longimicrobium sp.]|jgi:NAD-specific glutamate dehydrogenase|uniref:hypothetical protein n=1 Tax=Longimicrobium sp. TaxID=2029185 RepID=UPI002ED88301